MRFGEHSSDKGADTWQGVQIDKAGYDRGARNSGGVERGVDSNPFLDRRAEDAKTGGRENYLTCIENVPEAIREGLPRSNFLCAHHDLVGSGFHIGRLAVQGKVAVGGGIDSRVSVRMKGAVSRNHRIDLCFDLAVLVGFRVNESKLRIASGLQSLPRAYSRRGCCGSG